MGGAGCLSRHRPLLHPLLHLRVWCWQFIRQNRRLVQHLLCNLLGRSTHASLADFRANPQLFKFLYVHVCDLAFDAVADHDDALQLRDPTRLLPKPPPGHPHLRPVLLSSLRSHSGHGHRHHTHLHYESDEDEFPVPQILPQRPVNLYFLP